ncbi:MAG: chorismate synthase, partial [Calditrichia bacterium]|nr:chorismate synthase [Calditrichia bacterium]
MNTFGTIFRISIYGESHGKGVGVVIDGCPAGIPITEKDFENDLIRRMGGKSGTTPRIEPDKPNLLSGIFKGKTAGEPINIFFENTNIRSEDYKDLQAIPRPGHADFTAMKKYNGFNDFRGGGYFSGRLTLGIVAAGVIAKKIIQPISIEAVLKEAGGSTNIEAAVTEALKQGDSIGGLIECRAQNIPIGLGEPFFNSVESLISHIVFAIPAVKGIEFGAGFKATKMKGSEHNDLIVDINGTTVTNNAGGINGGITNGNDLVFRVAVKPTSSISKTQTTINLESGQMEQLNIKGRHDA